MVLRTTASWKDEMREILKSGTREEEVEEVEFVIEIERKLFYPDQFQNKRGNLLKYTKLRPHLGWINQTRSRSE